MNRDSINKRRHQQECHIYMILRFEGHHIEEHERKKKEKKETELSYEKL